MLKDKLVEDLKSAQKASDGEIRDTLRLLLSAIQNKEVEVRAERKGALSDEEVLGVLQKEAKKRKESIAAYEEGGRTELAAKERQELELIERYLPAELGEEELESIVDKAVAAVRPEGMKDFGRVMGEAVRTAKGRAEGNAIKKIVEAKLKQIG